MDWPVFWVAVAGGFMPFGWFGWCAIGPKKAKYFPLGAFVGLFYHPWSIALIGGLVGYYLTFAIGYLAIWHDKRMTRIDAQIQTQ